MSENKAPEQANQNNTEKPRQLGGNSNKSRPNKKLWAITSCAVVLLAAVGFGWLYLSNNVREDGSGNTSHSDTSKPVQSEKPALSSEQTSAYKHYDSLVRSGKYDEAAKYIETMPISDGAKKALREGLQQDSVGDDKRLAEVKQHEAAGTMTAGEAESAGDIYLQRNDKTKAIEYYKKAVKMFEKMKQTSEMKQQLLWLKQDVQGLENEN